MFRVMPQHTNIQVLNSDSLICVSAVSSLLMLSTMPVQLLHLALRRAALVCSCLNSPAHTLDQHLRKV